MSAYAQSSAPPVTVSAAKSTGGKGHGTLTGVSIDIVEKGFIGRCSYRGKPSKDGYPSYMPDKQFALADRKAVDKFLDDMLGLDKKK
mgnify:CR=1 FL=1